MNKWQIMLTTDPSIANAVGMLLDIIDNCGFQMDGAPMIGLQLRLAAGSCKLLRKCYKKVILF